MDAPDLTTLDDRQYEQLAVGHAHPRYRDADTWNLLTSPQHIERTRAVLANVHQRTAATLRRRKTERDTFQQECHARGEDGKKEWFATRPEYERWRRGTAGFHQMIQQAISELGKLQRQHNHKAMTQQGTQAAREALRRLSIAVQRHQAAHAKTGTIAAQEDYELWQLLDRLTVPCGPAQEQTSLRTMLDFYWTDVDMVTDAEADRARVESTMRGAPAGRSARYAGVPRARHVGNEKDLAG
ncbi:hypothetical protein [Streptomyces alboviridis]|uniref:hypothetical protein n=1 Tax=Streptomyces alboviridis TaxID=67269 RepID=UPI0005170AA1|nr:hypothetical protein [Streptomyces alboviridis]